MVIGSFELSRLPRVTFGEGAIARLPELAASYGKRLLLVTGASSLRVSRHGSRIERGLREHGLTWHTVHVDGEPSPELVDRAVDTHRTSGIELVVGIGGGSVLDAAKAIAGLLRSGTSVLDHLEGVGNGLPYTGPSVPLLAAPTTAGTGSEATKNAVLSVRGTGGYKKSFRDEALVARHAIVDPQLLETCPPRLVAADGMDALTQLLESFVSTRSSPVTEALATDGLGAVREGLLPWYEGTSAPAAARERMAYAALLSGITLAQTGLGAVHGLASPLGAFFPAPHGAVCGCLVAECTAANVAALRERAPGAPALEKYARAATILGAAPEGTGDTALDAFVGLLRQWTERLEIPRLRTWGVGQGDVDRIVAGSRGSSMKTNPILLTDGEIEAIVRRCL